MNMSQVKQRLTHLKKMGRTLDQSVKILNTESDFKFFVARDNVYRYVENKEDRHTKVV